MHRTQAAPWPLRRASRLKRATQCARLGRSAYPQAAPESAVLLDELPTPAPRFAAGAACAGVDNSGEAPFYIKKGDPSRLAGFIDSHATETGGNSANIWGEYRQKIPLKLAVIMLDQWREFRQK